VQQRPEEEQTTGGTAAANSKGQREPQWMGMGMADSVAFAGGTAPVRPEPIAVRKLHIAVAWPGDGGGGGGGGGDDGQTPPDCVVLHGAGDVRSGEQTPGARAHTHTENLATVSLGERMMAGSSIRLPGTQTQTPPDSTSLVSRAHQRTGTGGPEPAGAYPGKPAKLAGRLRLTLYE